MSEPLTDEEIAQLRDLEKNVTPGPWLVDYRAIYSAPSAALPETEVAWVPQDGRDADLIAESRNALPRLLDEVERLRARTETAERDLAYYKDRERHFAKLLAVSDGGQYRNDWDAAIEDLVKERDAYRKAKAENDERFQIAADEQRVRAEKAERERDDARAALERLRTAATHLRAATQFSFRGISAWQEVDVVLEDDRRFADWNPELAALRKLAETARALRSREALAEALAELDRVTGRTP